ncbi:hypothetical protein Caci_3049 [Catenulispora acidiphila DSM 44928]|uniref:Uncharacterized protein n=1 Tax=Catenulispora acidiphila (strain DSM 44928 / JCM 14897 / NBRC 102108 / NRRL B-24433 / ID139908) TaxID=479433 RepID=C7Q4I9_CATAD|nr:hypothetical protein [Catenulispora acidiphila]ACU71958.1 hypothetical protein Caci_3049 [Catenulispora acidiphila DSM 44928]
MTPKEAQLAEIAGRVRMWREDVAECRKRAGAARKLAGECDADAAHAEVMTRRWEIIHNAVRLDMVPGLESPVDPKAAEVSW